VPPSSDVEVAMEAIISILQGDDTKLPYLGAGGIAALNLLFNQPWCPKILETQSLFNVASGLYPQDRFGSR
jgi:hypothetical protein